MHEARPVLTLGEIARELALGLEGDPERRIQGIAPLERAGPGQLTFLANPRFKAQLATSQAAAVIVTAEMRPHCPVDALIADNPYLAYARLSQKFDDRPRPVAGIHPRAVVSPDAQVDVSASIGPHAVIEAGAVIGANVEIGANCFVGGGSSVGAGSRLAAGVTVHHNVRLGARVLVHSGAVIGADGFGFANDRGEWVKIAQLGGVTIEDDVEIGACTTIDRGALQDTWIGRGVKLDNLIQVAHNVEIGEQTAIAGCTGIAGSTKIGRRCTIAGGVGFAGHLEVADGVHVTGMSLVSKSIPQAGAYSSGTALSPQMQWKKNVVRFGQLDQLAKRLSALEKTVQDTLTKG